MLRRNPCFALLVVFGALLSASCSARPEASPSGKTHTVLIKGSKFEPERLEVAAGDTVIWKNEDIVPHTATAIRIFDSDNLDPGESWSYVAARKGTYPYICTYHPTMRAALVVRD